MPRFNSTANGLASLGRNGDTMLMHVNPQEVAGLSALLGSEPTINPDTGLPEAFNWGGIISGLFETVLGGALGDLVYEPIKDAAESTAKDLFSGLGQETAESIGKGVGVAGSALSGGLGGAGIGALGAALTGDNVGYGALGGFGSGAMSGGYYGLEHQDALGQAKPPMNQPSRYEAQKALNTNVGDYTKGVDINQGVEDSILNKPQGWNTPEPAPFSALEATSSASTAPTEIPSFWSWNDNFKKNLQPLMLSFGAGQSLKSMGEAEEYRKKQKERQMRLFADAGLDPYNLMRSYSFTSRGTGYADGGVVGYATEFGLPTQVYIPERYIDELKKSGGIGALAIATPVGHAQGGYINMQPFDPNNTYPQSMIPKAKPYAAAAPQRHEVVEGYEDGGFVEGDGDGMSDDIPALLEGEEEIRVADGEVIIPKAIVDMFGVEALDNMLKRVRMAAYGTDKQVKQDAGKEVVMDMLD